MADFDAIETFVAVVRAGSFRAAANTLRLPPSTVSQRVSRLETSLGVRLLERTTRVVRPTEAGAAYHERCARLLVELEEANAALRDARASPRGRIRVATPLLFGQTFLGAMAAGFVRKYPDVEVELVVSDRRVHLIEDGFDVAIVVAAHHDDSTSISRKLGDGELSCCAAPSYTKARGKPRAPEQLREHDCIVNREFIANESGAATWTFERQDEVRRVDVRGNLSMNSLLMVHEAARAGGGIALVPSFLCARDVDDGRLVRLFADWTIDARDIRVVYPSAQLSTRVRLFIEELLKEFPKSPGAKPGAAAKARKKS